MIILIITSYRATRRWRQWFPTEYYFYTTFVTVLVTYFDYYSFILVFCPDSSHWPLPALSYMLLLFSIVLTIVHFDGTPSIPPQYITELQTILLLLLLTNSLVLWRDKMVCHRSAQSSGRWKIVAAYSSKQEVVGGRNQGKTPKWKYSSQNK